LNHYRFGHETISAEKTKADDSRINVAERFDTFTNVIYNYNN